MQLVVKVIPDFLERVTMLVSTSAIVATISLPSAVYGTSKTGEWTSEVEPSSLDCTPSSMARLGG